MLSEDWKANAFEADAEGPPRRKLYVWQEQPAKPRDAPNAVSGWGFSVSSFDDLGRELPLWDTWAETFDEILLYPPEYAPRDIAWRRSGDGAVVDLYRLKN